MLTNNDTVVLDQTFVYAEVYKDIKWFVDTLCNVPSVRIAEDCTDVSPALRGNQYVLTSREGTDAEGKDIIGVFIYIMVNGEPELFMETMTLADPETAVREVNTIVIDPTNKLSNADVETLLLLCQRSIMDFREEMGASKQIH